jgi:hypothetical protein
VTFGRDETDTILVDLQITRGLLANDIWSNHQAFQGLLLSLDHLEVFNMTLCVARASILGELSSISSLLIFNLLNQILDIL